MDRVVVILVLFIFTGRVKNDTEPDADTDYLSC